MSDNPRTLSRQDRIDNLARVTGLPRALYIAENGTIVGTWFRGNAYGRGSGYHGAYPGGYLKRIAAMFPDKRRVLHLFSGKVDLKILPGDTVDINPELNPTYVDDGQRLTSVPLEQYDLVVADPPYTNEDANKYGRQMISRNRVVAALSRLSTGAHVVWLDQFLPMYRKDTFVREAAIGVSISTNHRFRAVTIFCRLP